MKIANTFSHMNGEEYLIVHHPSLYAEIKEVIVNVDAESCKTKESKERKMTGKLLYSPKELNALFKCQFQSLGWREKIYGYHITLNRDLMLTSMKMPVDKQKKYLLSKGELDPIYSYNQIDFIKNKVAVEIQFGKYAFVAFDLFIKHAMLYSGGEIDVGIEILPMKSMQVHMSTGVSYFEGEVYKVMRQGRSSPPVPLLIIGIEP